MEGERDAVDGGKRSCGMVVLRPVELGGKAGVIFCRQCLRQDGLKVRTHLTFDK